MPSPADRVSRFLVGCHPRRWRERYGEEMLDVLDQHQPTARTVVSLWASAVSAQLDPAWRTERLSLPRLRRVALISAAITASLMLVADMVMRDLAHVPNAVLTAVGSWCHVVRRGCRRAASLRLAV